MYTASPPSVSRRTKGVLHWAAQWESHSLLSYYSGTQKYGFSLSYVCVIPSELTFSQVWEQDTLLGYKESPKKTDAYLFWWTMNTDLSLEKVSCMVKLLAARRLVPWLNLSKINTQGTISVWVLQLFGWDFGNKIVCVLPNHLRTSEGILCEVYEAYKYYSVCFTRFSSCLQNPTYTAIWHKLDSNE